MSSQMTRTVDTMAQAKKVQAAMETLGFRSITIEAVGTWQEIKGDRELVFLSHGAEVLKASQQGNIKVKVDGSETWVKPYVSSVPTPGRPSDAQFNVIGYY